MKKSDIFFTVLVFVMFISLVNFKPDEKVELFEKELVKKESWLISELDSIASFMSFKESDHRYSNRQVLFDSRYASPEYDYIKLKGLYEFLTNRGWVDITSKVDKEEYILKTASRSKETAKHVHILCNNKATIFMYMTDMQSEYIIDLFKVRTLVHLKYNYTLPCYESNE